MQGKTINGFELKRLLGVGGMAEVWYAENRIGKKAAVKLLLPKLCQDENVVSRFLTEAKVMVDLNHPNIRQVYDYGELDGRPTIIMEYLEGDDLKARMKRGQRFTDEELKHWWNQLVDALDYTHKKGIVHRDIKPGNIFVDTEGNIKLLDFGIAKVRDSISTTQTGQKLGTLMYMSPEQVKDSKHIDYKTDVYSLAVTFVHLITGKKPYDSDTSSNYDIEVNIVTKPLDLSGLPVSWRDFLLPYLNKEASQRPALRGLDSMSNGFPHTDDEGTIVGKSNPSTQPLDEHKSKKSIWIAIGVLAVSILVLVLLHLPDKGHEGNYTSNSETIVYCEPINISDFTLQNQLKELNVEYSKWNDLADDEAKAELNLKAYYIISENEDLIAKMTMGQKTRFGNYCELYLEEQKDLILEILQMVSK